MKVKCNEISWISIYMYSIVRVIAGDLVDNFESTFSKLGMLSLGNVSMVRPNANWLFFDKLSVMRKDEQLMFTLVGTRNCSLPSVHGAL